MSKYSGFRLYVFFTPADDPDEYYPVVKVIKWWKLSSDESYQVSVFAAHVLAKIKIFDEIMEKFQFSYSSQKLMIWNNFLKMSLFWSIYMRKQ